jgi:hypothetical protein
LISIIIFIKIQTHYLFWLIDWSYLRIVYIMFLSNRGVVSESANDAALPPYVMLRSFVPSKICWCNFLKSLGGMALDFLTNFTAETGQGMAQTPRRSPNKYSEW